ncbi:MAG: hypothetical protein ACI8UO_000300 [Verrucomicrobiales bacterium]|jgi:hypothetical protein
MLVTTEAKEIEKKKGRMNKGMVALLAAFAIHLLVGGTALFVPLFSSQKHEPKIIAHVIAPPAEAKKSVEKEEVKKQAQKAAQVSAPPIAQLLRANANAMVAAPKMMAVPDTPIGLGEGNLSVGFSSNGGSSMGRGAVFFGTKVQGKLGVVFDVSGSMHQYVPLVVEEINSKFRTAMVICVNSSAMKETTGDPQVVPYLDATPQTAAKPGLFTDDARKMDSDLAALPNCYFINKKDNTLGAGIEFLVGENVTNIFVFSDFQDSYDGKWIEGLTSKASGARAKVHLHLLKELASFYKTREPFLQGLSQKTGGVYAVGELLKRAGR